MPPNCVINHLVESSWLASLVRGKKPDRVSEKGWALGQNCLTAEGVEGDSPDVSCTLSSCQLRGQLMVSLPYPNLETYADVFSKYYDQRLWF